MPDLPLDRLDAVVFDTDGVLTDTARVHAAAWARLFDGYLERRAARLGGPWRPFTRDDYLRHVNGRPRYDGVAVFLVSRGIVLHWGDPADPPDREEETPRLHLNPSSGRWLPDRSHRQRHVNAAIAWNVWQYYQAAGDLAFLEAHGAEMLLEIARFWASVATYDHALDRYQIRGVMGPDEYHDGYPDRDEGGLDNHACTNVMAAWMLGRALETLEVLGDHRRVELAERLGLAREELGRWDEISRKLRVCFHDGDIISQFEGYGELEELDWEGLRRRHGDIRRLDRILEASGDTTNRYKASKQADVLMLFYLLSAEELRGPAGTARLPAGAVRHPPQRRLLPGPDLARLDPVRGGQRLGPGPLGPAPVLAVLHRGPGLRPPRRPGRHHRRGHPPRSHGRHGGPGPALLHRAGDPRRCARLNPSLPDELHGLDFDVRYRGHWGISLHLTPGGLRVRVPATGADPVPVAVGDQVVELAPGSAQEFRL
jgi:hypothetical protein